MKRYIATVWMILLCAVLAGCTSWQSGSYHSVKPHMEDNSNQTQESSEASNYLEIQEILIQMIADGSESGVIYANGIDREQLEEFLDIAVHYATERDAIGAFAVKQINCDIGTSTGRMAIAVNIAYNRSRFEILRIKQTENMDEAKQVISDALDHCDAGVVIHVKAYQAMDIAQWIQDYADNHPDVCIEAPQVSEMIYPESGAQRVMELTFTYQTSRESLRSMQTYVEPVFRAAGLNVSGEENESTKFDRMYAFLMERSDYQIETSITPAYSLLRHGVGDSKAFATVYAEMCRQANLDCQTVTGTRNGEPWVWNLICEDGVYSHVDLLRSAEEGRLIRHSQEQMEGYVWDYSAYPEAEGPQQETIEDPSAGTDLQEPGVQEPNVTQDPADLTEPTDPSTPTEPTAAPGPAEDPDETEPASTEPEETENTEPESTPSETESSEITE